MEKTNKAIILPIGDRIKTLRTQSELTQIELSRLANVGYGTLRKVETGKTKEPSSIFCAKIAIALHISVEQIIFIEFPHTY